MFLFAVNANAPSQPQFTYGTRSNHGIFDVYVGGTLWMAYLNESLKNTPDVKFLYDVIGNCKTISEYMGTNFTKRVRETQLTITMCAA